MIRALVFDLDGVLVDAVEWHYEAFVRAISVFGYGIAREEHHALYNGLPTKTKLEILSQRSGLPRALHPFLNDLKQQYTREIVERELRPSDELTQTLAALKEQGYRLAVATNCTRASLDLFLSKLGIADFFEFALSQEEVARAKPDPAIYQEALRRFAVTPSELAIIEDSLTGIAAASAVTRNLIVVRGPNELTRPRLLRELVRRQNELQCGRTAQALDFEIVIPMAGEGVRFQQKGYPDPKPLIPIFGRPMVDWVVENLSPSEGEGQAHRFTFLCRRNHLDNTPLRHHLKRLSPDCQIVEVPSATQGAACTVLLAAGHIDLEKPLVIANVDQWIGVSLDGFYRAAREKDCDGLILTFPAHDTKWSYARTDATGRVAEVAEKIAISPHATTGIYYYRKGRYFVESAQAVIKSGERTNGEFYVCPVYNEMIRQGKSVYIYGVAEHEMHGLGTPEDLEAFIRWHLPLSNRGSLTTPDPTL